jgi:hypothetical protein
MPKAPSRERLSGLSVGLLIVIVIRSLGEILRLRYVHGDALTIDQALPFAIGAEIAAVAAIVMFFLFCIRRHLAVMLGTVATVAGLLVYKLLMAG